MLCLTQLTWTQDVVSGPLRALSPSPVNFVFIGYFVFSATPVRRKGYFPQITQNENHSVEIHDGNGFVLVLLHFVGLQTPTPIAIGKPVQKRLTVQ